MKFFLSRKQRAMIDQIENERIEAEKEKSKISNAEWLLHAFKCYKINITAPSSPIYYRLQEILSIDVVMSGLYKEFKAEIEYQKSLLSITHKKEIEYLKSSHVSELAALQQSMNVMMLSMTPKKKGKERSNARPT
jgi:hypothetical protein